MLENYNYCPILHTRNAEIKALTHLPTTAKELIFPILVARPWPNANSLSRTWEKIHEAFGNRRFALDLDQTKYRSGSTKPAGSEFDQLFAPDGGFENYYALIETIPLAIPVLRLTETGIPDLAQQRAHISRLDRGAILRLRYGKILNPWTLVDEVLAALPDCVVVIDVGWGKHPLNLELLEFWSSRIISEVLKHHAATEIVVASGSFPDSFSDNGARGEVRIDERVLFQNLTRAHNRANLIYGDWASTRSPQNESVPMKNVGRIDLPIQDRWICFRQNSTSESYQQIASRVVSDSEWPQNLVVWGTHVIDATARGLPNAIRGQAAAAAVRVNLHLLRQAHAGDSDLPGEVDEPFTDE